MIAENVNANYKDHYGSTLRCFPLLGSKVNYKSCIDIYLYPVLAINVLFISAVIYNMLKESFFCFFFLLIDWEPLPSRWIERQ